MKKFILIIPVIVIIAAFVFYLQREVQTPKNVTSKAANETEVIGNKKIIEVNGFSVVWYEVNDPNSLRLVPNFEEKLTSAQILAKDKCRFLSSSTFYSTDNKPLGLIVAGGKLLSDFWQSNLLDGILSINGMATPRITRNVPEDPLDTAVQTGPIIKENGNFLKLTIQQDSEARRMVAGVTGENKLFFLVFYKGDSLYMGPKLADLPNLIADFEKTSRITFADVVNLDGGSASAFISDNINLSELSPVGAFFCQP